MSTRKVVIGPDVCGFSMSSEALELYGSLAGIPLYRFDRLVTFKLSEKSEESRWYETELYTKPLIELCLIEPNSMDYEYRFTEFEQDIKRDDPILVKVVERLGNAANLDGRPVKIVEIPDDIEWYIGSGDDGSEWVSEMHRIWR